jgi:hypothetical protein
MITVALLGVLTVGGVAGGLAFVTDPSGGRLGMSVDELPAWPLLGNYLVPGIALIVLFGVLPAIAAVLVARRDPRGWTATAAVGLLVVFWTMAQLVVVRLIFAELQIGFLVVGILLTGLGLDGAAQQRAADHDHEVMRS